MSDKKQGIPGRELKPGKILTIAGRIFKGASIKTQDNKSKEKKGIPAKSTCFVPESLIKEYNLPEHHFVGGKDKPASEAAKK
jgi:hypothetical protein